MILYINLIFFLFFQSKAFGNDCNCCMEEEYFNELILSHHITMLDISSNSNHSILYKYDLNISGCVGDVSIDVVYKIISPEIGINTFETFYIGSIKIEPLQNYFTNNNIVSGIIPYNSSNKKLELLISYISKSGQLPNGNYLFYFTLNSNSLSSSITKSIDIDRPLSIELLSPGTSSLAGINNSYTYSTLPLFNWYSEYCPKCEFGIRICEYNPDYHKSLEDALSQWSLVPNDQSYKFHPINWNANSFQYPIVGHIDLEMGKYYVWQIKRSFNTTLGPNNDYSSINVFEIRYPEKIINNNLDKYLSLIELIIGKEKFDLLFGNGGDLENFTIDGDIIKVNDEEVHIDGLYSILSDLKQNKIKINDIQVK